jgi:hypothetical protein
LLQTQRHAIFLSVKLQNLGSDFLTSCHHFRWVTNTAPSHVSDVQQAVDTAQIHKRAVFGDVLHNTLNDGAFLQCLHQLGALFAHAGFHHGAT